MFIGPFGRALNQCFETLQLPGANDGSQRAGRCPIRGRFEVNAWRTDQLRDDDPLSSILGPVFF